MGSLTDYSENAWLNHLFGTSYTPASTVYLALATADPTDAATGNSFNEVANSGSYARTAITFAAAASRAVAQTGVVTFPASSGSWGTVTHWAVVTSATYGSGNVLAHGALSSSVGVVSGNTVSVASGQVIVSANAGSTAGFTNYLVHKLLDLMFRNTAYTQPSTYVALATATMSDSTTTPTEPSGNNYSRVVVNKTGGGSPAWGTVASGAVNNANAITMPTPSGSWGTIVAAALMDASSSGNTLVYDNGITDQAVGNGDTVQFASSAFAVSIT